MRQALVTVTDSIDGTATITSSGIIKVQRDPHTYVCCGNDDDYLIMSTRDGGIFM